MSVTFLQDRVLVKAPGSLQWSIQANRFPLAAVSPESRKECEMCRWLDLEMLEMLPASVSKPRVSALVSWENDLQVPCAGWMGLLCRKGSVDANGNSAV